MNHIYLLMLCFGGNVFCSQPPLRPDFAEMQNNKTVKEFKEQPVANCPEKVQECGKNCWTAIKRVGAVAYYCVSCITPDRHPEQHVD